MTSRLLIVGAGSQARYVIASARRIGGIEIIGLIDSFENGDYWGRRIDDVEVLGGRAALDAVAASPDLGVVLAIADVRRKRELTNVVTQRGHRFTSIIHPTAIIAADAHVAEGVIINAGAIIERGVRIGRHVIIHAGCVVEHDNVIGDFANLAPGVVTAGRVVIEAGATVFTGARIVPDVIVGAEAIVGAGAVVIRSVAPRTTVVGVPARVIASARAARD